MLLGKGRQQWGDYLGSDACYRPPMQRPPIHLKIALGSFPRVRPQVGLLRSQITINDNAEFRPVDVSLGRLLRGRIYAELNLGKPLGGSPLRILEGEFTNVAEAFSSLLPTDAILNDIGRF